MRQGLFFNILFVISLGFAEPLWAGPGEGQQAHLTISDAPVYDFGEIIEEQTVEHSFEVHNDGTLPTALKPADTLAVPFSYKGGVYPGTGGTCDFWLRPGQECTVVVQFSPLASGSFQSELSLIYTSSLGKRNTPERVTRPLRGTSVASAPELFIVSGNNQTGAIGTTLPSPLVVIAKNQLGNPVPNVRIEWTITLGDGTVSSGSTITESTGTSQVDWTLGPIVGENQLTATLQGRGAPVTFTATAVQSGPPASITIQTGAPESASAGAPLPNDLQVIVRDSNGLLVLGATIDWNVTSGGGSLNPSTSVTDPEGIASSSWTLGVNPGQNTATATVRGTNLSVEFQVQGVPGSATQIAVVSGNNQVAPWNAMLPQSPAVIVKDAFGNPKAGAVVIWTLIQGDGSVSQTSSITNSGGYASVNWTLGSEGINLLRATLAGTDQFVNFTALGTTLPFTKVWPFDSGTSDEYEFDSHSIELSGGVVRLKQSDAVDDDEGVSGFGGGRFSGATTWDNVNQYLRLGQYPACESSVCGEFDSTWTPQWEHIVGLWHLNETAPGTGPGGTDFVDSSPFGNNGVISGTLTLGTPGKLAAAPTFSPTVGNMLTIQGSRVYATSHAPFSVSAWEKVNTFVAGNTYPMVVKLRSDTTNPLELAISNDNNFLGIVFGSNGTVERRTNVTFNPYLAKWNHLMLIYNGAGVTDPANYTIYLNGNAVPHVQSAVFAPRSQVTIFGGNDLAIYRYNGQVDEVAVWNTALTPAEVQEVYSRQSALFSGDFVSRVMDAFSPQQIWTAFSWLTTLPFWKELPDFSNGAIQNERSSDYSSLVGSTGSVGDNDLMNGMIALYHMNEASWNGTAGEVIDDSGKGNHAVRAGNATTSTNSVFGRAGFFNAGSDAVNTPITPSTAFSNFTISFWGSMQSFTSTGFNFYISNSSNFVFRSAGVTTSDSVFLALGNWTTTGGVALGASGTQTGVWHQYAITRNGSSGELYIDGVLRASRTGITITLPATAFSIGRALRGNVDEFAIWNTALNSKEIAQLYRRGANRIKFQVRTCSSADCSDDPKGQNWKGSDGTNQTFFTEFNNNTVPSDGSGDVKATSPSMIFSDFGFTLTPNRYFQYRTLLETDDYNLACNYGSGASACSPELESVKVDPVHYAKSSAVTGRIGVDYYSLITMVETLGTSCPAGVSYNLGLGVSADSATWYWWDGAWIPADGGMPQSNSVAEVNAHLSEFATQLGRGKVFVRAFLNSSGTQPCELDQIELLGKQ